MIQQANRSYAAANPPVPSSSTAQQQQQQLPLIRLRVDYTGFGTVNSQRFGQKYVGKVSGREYVHVPRSDKLCVPTIFHMHECVLIATRTISTCTMHAYICVARDTYVSHEKL
jgi:double-strand break repair protein MRE11